MTRHEALTELIEKVEAGEEVTARAASRVWPKGYAHAVNAGTGSLDAALALHEAVLPGCPVLIDYIPSPNSCVVGVETPDEKNHEGRASTPARAWLLSILYALRDGGDDE